MNGAGKQSPMALFQQEAPGAAGAFHQLIRELSEGSSLDAKTRQLIYIGMKAMQGDTAAVAAHTPMAKQAGATREELKDTILLTLTVSGIRGVVSCLPQALEIYDTCTD
jgi:AhpD family alkylhydroperoxidase